MRMIIYLLFFRKKKCTNCFKILFHGHKNILKQNIIVAVMKNQYKFCLNFSFFIDIKFGNTHIISVSLLLKNVTL